MIGITNTRNDRTDFTHTEIEKLVDFISFELLCLDYNEKNEKTICLLEKAKNVLNYAISIMITYYGYSTGPDIKKNLDRNSRYTLEKVIEIAIEKMNKIIQTLPFARFKGGKKLIEDIQFALVCLHQANNSHVV